MQLCTCMYIVTSIIMYTICSCWETAGSNCTHLPPPSRAGTTPGICEGVCVLYCLGVQHRTSCLQAVCGSEMVGRGVTWDHFQVELADHGTPLMLDGPWNEHIHVYTSNTCICSFCPYYRSCNCIQALFCFQTDIDCVGLGPLIDSV